MDRDWGGFPNLQLIGERFYTSIKEVANQIAQVNYENNKTMMEENPDYFKTHSKLPTEVNFEILGLFQQFWPNTAGLFENGGFSGQSMSTYYTTVLRDNLTGYHAVFQDNDLVYAITNSFEDGELNVEEFYKDIDNHSIKPLKEINSYWKIKREEEEEPVNESGEE